MSLTISLRYLTQKSFKFIVVKLLSMKEPWYCLGTEKIKHPPTENYGNKCSLPSCSNPRPVSLIIRSWLPWIAVTSGGALATILFFVFTPKAYPILFLHIMDESASALNNEDFRQGVQQVCEGVADTARSNFDYTSPVIVYSKIEAQDPQLISSSKSFREGCQNKSQIRPDAQLGTFICPAWEEAIRQINLLPDDVRPIVITQVQTNEEEKNCNSDSVLKNLYEKLLERKGFHAVVGSTNAGKTEYNKTIRNFVNNPSNPDIKARTKIFSGNPATCIKKISNFVRYNQEIENTSIQC
jgi:hypothetical protein